MKKKVPPPQPPTGPFEMIKTADLHFDRQNPRLAGYLITATSTDSEIIRTLWDQMDVKEVVLSIAASGFFKHEPLIVDTEGGKEIVIEGNRRLAAVKLLTSPTLATELGIEVPSISQKDRNALESLPVQRMERKDAWRFLGFKHVNGPARWDSYAKSKYIADVHLKQNVPLTDIALQIGDTHKTVQRLFRGYRVIEQAEEKKVYSREDRWDRGFYFSHLYTGLGYQGFVDFLSLKPEESEDANPVPPGKLEELGQLMEWLFGSKKKKHPPIIKSQNPDLRHLEAVLRHREALAALKSGIELDLAFEITRPAGTVLEEELVKAKQSLQKVRGLLSTGYDGSADLLAIANQVADIADDLAKEMERMRNPSERRRRGNPQNN